MVTQLDRYTICITKNNFIMYFKIENDVNKVKYYAKMILRH